VRRPLRFKYHRITGAVPLHDKAPHEPGRAKERTASHAGNFLLNRVHQCRHMYGLMGKPPVTVHGS